MRPPQFGARKQRTWQRWRYQENASGADNVRIRPGSARCSDVVSARSVFAMLANDEENILLTADKAARKASARQQQTDIILTVKKVLLISKVGLSKIE